MYKLFFATFFIAELVIAFAVIKKICDFDRLVNALSDELSGKRASISYLFVDIRLAIEDFNTALSEFVNLLNKKREEYLLKFLKTSLIYSSLFLLKGKYKKAVFAYQFAKEVYEGITEA